MNSTLVYLLSAVCSTVEDDFSNLFDIDTRGPFKYLSRISTGKRLFLSPGGVLERQLDSLAIYDISSYNCDVQVGGVLPRASKTCPDLSEPSGRVKETISLYLGNLT